MQKFTTHTGTIAPLRRNNVDTDQIIPAVYLKRVTKTGFEDGLFAAWRANEKDFVLNRPEYSTASILVTGPDFGTGSSREHAVWALRDGGFRVVISPRFADIFRGNSLKDGLLTIVLPETLTESLMDLAEAEPTAELTVDLEARVIRIPENSAAIEGKFESNEIPFEIDDYSRWRLLEGLDDIGLTLKNGGDIDKFEAKRPSFKPSTTPA
ncbi:3-isopropylmalate dehydratase small subunit [Epidermidibacterium keratini]|uniref:3-isopropylmalate dehydratase small subunit n=1 Tax=Epidermidibacterium keratini TaxID=1891644 RepID=A0A7L4YRM8_9ACTN|nr:3-isopropylmalate dehydratase small subunit [Epidermidibacterium keratini]QHC01796.1 3-isopropylmalate dehydratase small subunit [Epidermidibacterium keratini]